MANEPDDKVIDDGGHAFPTLFGSEADGLWGMSVRMWLAGQAMKGMLACNKFWEVRCIDHEIPAPETVAQDAFAYADAHIAESKR